MGTVPFFLFLGTVPISLLLAQSDPKIILRELKSQDPGVQQQAKERLRAYRFKDIVRNLTEFANDPNPDMRILMAQVIGELGGPDAAKSLKKLYSWEKDEKVRRALLIQIAGLIPDQKESFQFFRRVSSSDRNQEIRFLALSQIALMDTAKIKRELISLARKILKKDPYQDSKILAAILLKELGESVPNLNALLLKGLKSPSVEIRRRSARQVAAVQHLKDLNSLSFVAEDPDAEVRANLTLSLSESQSPAAIPILKGLTQDADWHVRKRALEALTSFSPKEVELSLFLNALADPESSVRIVAIGAIERWGDASHIPELEKISENEPDPQVLHMAKKAISTLSTKK